MKHAREDYNCIQDPDGIIPADEPVFLLRAKDLVAPWAVRRWANRAREVGAGEEIVQAAFAQADEMERWQMEHGSKVPDLPLPEPAIAPKPEVEDEGGEAAAPAKGKRGRSKEGGA